MNGTSVRGVLSALFCFLFCIAVSAQERGQDVSKIVGKWSYSAPDAPYGYQDGSLEFKSEKGKLTAKINIQGSVIEVKEIKVHGDTYSSSFYVDGNPIDLSITQNESKLEGIADTGGVSIPVTFRRTE